jgi:hypothetical protein
MAYNQFSNDYSQSNGDSSSPKVPLALSIKILFGSLFAQMSWFFVVFGMIFVFIFARNVDFSNYYLGVDSPKAIGKVTQIEDTGYWHNKKPVYAIIYQFNDSQGNIQAGISYAIGNSFNISDSVNIQYLANKPTYSRIEGLLKSTTQPFGLIVLIFPLIGVILVIRNLFLAFKTLKLQKNRQSRMGQLSPNISEQMLFNEPSQTLIAKDNLPNYLQTNIEGTFAPKPIRLASVLPYLILPILAVLEIGWYVSIILF